jgi:transposase-like protein
MNTPDTTNISNPKTPAPPRRKRSFTDEEKTAMVKEIGASSVAAVARKYKVGANQLRDWRRQMQGLPGPVVVATDPRAACEAQLLQIQEHRQDLNIARKKLIAEINSGKANVCNAANALSGLARAHCALVGLTFDTIDRLQRLPAVTPDERKLEEWEQPALEVQREAERWVYAFVKAEVEAKARAEAALSFETEEDNEGATDEQ